MVRAEVECCLGLLVRDGDHRVRQCIGKWYSHRGASAQTSGDAVVLLSAGGHLITGFCAEREIEADLVENSAVRVKSNEGGSPIAPYHGSFLKGSRFGGRHDDSSSGSFIWGGDRQEKIQIALGFEGGRIASNFERRRGCDWLLLLF